jgi:hypothetical protein
MNYTQIEVSRDLVRDELFSYLRESQHNLGLSQPPRITGASGIWAETTGQVGFSVNKFVNEIFERLLSSGKANAINVPVNDSTIMSAYEAYYPLQIKTLILEEIFELVQGGVVIKAKFKRESTLNFNFEFDLITDILILTEYGAQFISEEPVVPYFVERYLERLRKIAELDEILQGYLAEGLACLRNHLGRASAVLLRLAAEHTLAKLIDSMEASMQEKEAQKFKGQVRKAGIKIEERAEVAFRKLEASTELLPKKYSKSMVSNRLRPAFHSIRDLGGRAAHLSSHISLEEVKDHYALYVTSVYAIAMEIAEYQKTIAVSS